MDKQQVLDKATEFTYDLLADGSNEALQMAGWISAGCVFLTAEVLETVETEIIAPIMLTFLLTLETPLTREMLDQTAKQLDVEVLKRILKKGN